MQIGAAMRVVGLSFLLADGTAAAEPIDTDCIAPKSLTRPAVTRSDIDRLIGWIALKTDYDLSSVYRDPPEIVFCQVGEMVEYEP